MEAYLTQTFMKITTIVETESGVYRAESLCFESHYQSLGNIERLIIKDDKADEEFAKECEREKMEIFNS